MSSKEALIKFCEFICHIDPNAWVQKLPSALTEFERESFLHLDRFKALCRSLPSTHYPDAFHLWTSERNHLDFFLTVDKTFINVMTQTSKATLPVPPLLPYQLLRHLGLSQRDLFPVLEKDFYYFYEPPWLGKVRTKFSLIHAR